MNIHEYQAKALLKEYNLPVLQGGLAHSAIEAEEIAHSIKSDLWVIKAQIHAGGRGKGGGIQLAHSLPKVKEYAQRLIGQSLVTPQTGPEGKTVHKVYIEQGCSYQKELYISILIDRDTHQVTFIASSEGGMDIEEVASHHPEKIIQVTCDILNGFKKYHSLRILKVFNIERSLHTKLHVFLENLYQAFLKMDASLIEINPLVLTDAQEFMILDAKISLDENALYRHPNYEQLRDPNEEDPYEREAASHDLNYIKLDGSIGCMVNGAGLAMATMDIIQYYGGAPANFLDVGGGASKEKVTEAFKIILKDTNVKVVLVNIFGGIMRCDVIAEGILAALNEIAIRIPLVVRLEGTKVEEGKEILHSSCLDIITADTLAEAAQKAVHLLKG